MKQLGPGWAEELELEVLECQRQQSNDYCKLLNEVMNVEKRQTNFTTIVFMILTVAFGALAIILTNHINHIQKQNVELQTRIINLEYWSEDTMQRTHNIEETLYTNRI